MSTGDIPLGEAEQLDNTAKSTQFARAAANFARAHAIAC